VCSARRDHALGIDVYVAVLVSGDEAVLDGGGDVEFGLGVCVEGDGSVRCAGGGMFYRYDG
jgi:hypothetical protein